MEHTAQQDSLRIAIIGGGAVGIFGAITAATNNSSVEVVVFEATGEALDKVRVSGGGRCNVTHNCFDPVELVKGYPRGHKELRGAFSRFQAKDTVEWFKSRGVKLKAESDGRMFPITDDSATIVNCLLDAARQAGVRVRLNARVKEVVAIGTATNPQFEIELHDGSRHRFDRVLIATGSAKQGHRFAEGLGHTIVPCVPSLFTFKVKDARINELAGVSIERVKLTLVTPDNTKFEQTGPMLITHWGLSGPAVLKLSAWGARELHDTMYHAALTANFEPDVSVDDLYAALLEFKQAHGKKRVSTDGPFDLPRRYWSRIVQYVGVGEDVTWTNLTKEAMQALISESTSAEFAVVGKGIFKEEFVTCGGVSLREVDFATMQSKVCPGLFLAGEVLDIDGITGGYNFQSAWTTGWLAGRGMGETETNWSYSLVSPNG